MEKLSVSARPFDVYGMLKNNTKGQYNYFLFHLAKMKNHIHLTHHFRFGLIFGLEN